MRIWIPLLLFLAFPVAGRGEVILSNLGKTTSGNALITSNAVALQFNATGPISLSSATLRFFNGHVAATDLVGMQANISLGLNSLTSQAASNIVDLGGKYYDITFSLIGLSPLPWSGANTLSFSNIVAWGGSFELYSTLAPTSSGWDVNTTNWTSFGSNPYSSGNLIQISISAVPEPGTMALSVCGVMIMGLIACIRKKAKIRLAMQ